MRRSVIGWLALVVLVLGGSALAWVWFAGGSGDPSTELITPPIDTTTTQNTTTIPEGTTTTPEGTTSTVHGGDATAFVIDPARSTATYEIDEILRGDPNQVVGVTDQLAGQVLVDLSDPGGARFSPIVINARTFQTDSGQRDRVVRGPVILNSADDQFEFITFEVTSVDGLDGPLAPGDEVDLEVTGDLTIKGTTRPVRFEVSVTVVDESTISGVATAEMLRSDFGIGIPQVSFVAGVSDEVAIRLEFVAVSG